MSTQNPVSFRVPVNVDKSVHPTVRQALQDHDDGITDLRQANESLTSQVNALQAQVKALQGKK
jgi:peptidoglycan hydrolase CwlO-like protein